MKEKGVRRTIGCESSDEMTDGRQSVCHHHVQNNKQYQDLADKDEIKYDTM